MQYYLISGTKGGVSYEEAQNMPLDEFMWFSRRYAEDVRRAREEANKGKVTNTMGLENYEP